MTEEMNGLFESAKELLLRDGALRMPQMTLEYHDISGEACIDLLVFADGGIERMQMFDLGMHFAQDHPEILPDHLERLVLVMETWTSSIPPEKREKKRPRPIDDPNRGEALVALVIEIMPSPGGMPSLKRRAVMAKILRHGDIIDLAPAQERTEIKGESGLDHFLAGFGAGHLSAEEIAQIIKEVEEG